MAGFYPVPATRSSSFLAQTRLLQQLNLDQLAIQRLQTQISTGRRVLVPSDDAPAALRGQTLQRLLELKAQAQINIQTSQSYLDASDTALSNVAKLISDVRGLAVEANSDTSTDQQRQTAAEEVGRAIEQLLSVANQNFRGRYLFGGSRADGAPFVHETDGIVYRGNEGLLCSFVDLDLPYPTSASGTQVFGTFSPQVVGTVDLNPALSADTPLSSLNGGQGVTLGSIRIGDGTNESIIDLSSAATLGDVADLLQANPPAGRTITALVTPTGLSIDIDDAGGGNLTIREVPGGTTADSLRILNDTGSGVLPTVGGDLNPTLRLTTPLADLQTTLPLDLASGLQITNNGQTYTIDTSTAVTVEDLLNAINDSPANTLGQISPGGDRLVVRSLISGPDFSIGENGGTTATQLGIRSLTVDTLLADLNYGRGVTSIPGTDFTIHRRDGFDLAIDVSSAATIGDVIDLINNDAANLNPATRVVARLSATGNGIELFDGNLAGPDQLSITRQFGSNAAWDLGLIPQDLQTVQGTSSPGGDLLTSTDPNPLDVAGVFNTLLRLQESLENFHRGDLERAVALLDEDFDRINFARGELGARNRTIDTIQAQLEDETVLLQSNLADEIETDLPAAISALASRQAALQASLQMSAQIFSVSLLDYL
jgi:flagellar hook-associated protein 3 FlgL